MRLLSPNAAQILSVFLDAPTVGRYGYELLRLTNMKSGSMYPILGRFERLGWIVGSMEPSPGGRPPRRVYCVDIDNLAAAREELDRFVEAKDVDVDDRFSWSY